MNDSLDLLHKVGYMQLNLVIMSGISYSGILRPKASGQIRSSTSGILTKRFSPRFSGDYEEATSSSSKRLKEKDHESQEESVEYVMVDEETDILADKRRTHSIEDDIVLILYTSMLESITDSWDGKTTMRTVLRPKAKKLSYALETPSQSGCIVSENSDLSKNEEALSSTIVTKRKPSISAKKRSRSQDMQPSLSQSTPAAGNERDGLITILKNESNVGSSWRKSSSKLKLLKDQNVSIGNISIVLEGTNSMLDEYLRGSKHPSTERTGRPPKQLLDAVKETAEAIEKNFDWRILFPDEDASIVFTNGNEYEGHISRKTMEGNGHFRWTDGSTYEGEFTDGAISGRGKLVYSDLSWYEGECKHGFRHGSGLFVAFGGTVSYYGTWYLGKKHGSGTIYYGDKGDNYYNGDFYDGERHGYGARQYPSGTRYVGEWNHGQRDGVGTMVFSNGDVYIGNWKNGQINGPGEYIWGAFVNTRFTQPREDIFRGNWVSGVRHGKGTLQRSCMGDIYGEWVDNQKDGTGMIVTSNGEVIKGNPLFLNDMLQGKTDEKKPIVFPSVILQPIKEKLKNQTLTKTKEIASRSDKSLSHITQMPSKGSLNSSSKKLSKTCIIDECNKSRIIHESRGNPQKIMLHNSEFCLSYQLDRLLESMRKCKNTEELELQKKSIPDQNDKSITKEIRSKKILSNIEITQKTDKYDFDYESDDMGTHPEVSHNDPVKVIEPSDVKVYSNTTERTIYDTETKEIREYEQKWLSKAITQHINALRTALKAYCSMTTTEEVDYEISVIRLIVWQFERDCGFQEKGICLAEVDEYVAANPYSNVLTVHEPFERIDFYLFLQYIMELSWQLYGNKRIGYEGAPGILASAFHKLIIEDVLPNLYNHKGNALFKYLNLLPIEAVYSLYKNIGEPHTARDFLTSACIPKGGKLPPIEYVPPKWYPHHIRYGTNVIYLASNIIYLAGPEPLSYSKKNPKLWFNSFSEDEPTDPYSIHLLTVRNLRAKRILKNLVEICPAIKSEELICKIDYKLTFLEFYEVLLLCAETSLLKVVEIEQKKIELREKKVAQLLEPSTPKIIKSTERAKISEKNIKSPKPSKGSAKGERKKKKGK